MSKAVLFIRVSTEQQTTESQRDALMHYAMADGYSAKDIVFIEKKESGYKLEESEREGLVELYKAMDEPETSDVYIWELSRLSRRPKDLYSIREKFLERRIQLHCQEPSFTLLNKERTGYDSNANILFSLFGAMAEQEVIEKKARFARGKKRLAEQGRYNGGAIPYGYKKDVSQGNLIIIDEEVEAPIVREVFNLYERGMSQPAIAKELFSRGIKGRAARKTKKFTISLVHQILTNELLTGKAHKSKGASYERRYPQIITEEQFLRCRKIAEVNNLVLPKSRRIYYAHKLIECTECKRAFVSTGRKNYYHCRDAYDYNKQYQGYEGVPRCSNRTTISTNIMDSLLWALAIKYETFFILNEANKQIETYKERIQILKQKIAAIPARLEALEEEQERLNETYTRGGRKKEKWLEGLAEIDRKKRAVMREKAEFLRDIEHFELMRVQAQKALEMDYKVDKYLSRAEAIYRKVSSITDDKERSEIIHRHIEKVIVEKTTLSQTFEKHPDGKEVLAKKITVYPFGGEEEIYYFIPNDGKGGHMLAYRDYEKAYSLSENPNWNRHVKPYPIRERTMIPFEMQYLPRLKDEGKYRRREIVRANREALESEAIDKLRKKGYISMNEMRLLSNLSYSTIYNAIKSGRLKAENLFKTWYARKKDFTLYLEKYKPQPRPYRHKNEVYRGEPKKEED